MIINLTQFLVMHLKNYSEIKTDIVEEPNSKGVYIQWLIDETIGKTFAMRRFTIKPDGFTPHHKHDWEHEVFVLEGQGSIVDKDGVEHPVSKGNFIYVEPNEIHQFANHNDNDFIFLCLIPLQ